MEAKDTARLELSEEQMRDYGYKVVDAIVEHHLNQHKKKPTNCHIASKPKQPGITGSFLK